MMFLLRISDFLRERTAPLPRWLLNGRRDPVAAPETGLAMHGHHAGDSRPSLVLQGHC